MRDKFQNNSMNIYTFIPFICGLLCLGIGFFVNIKAGKSYLSRPYFLISLSLFCYCFMYFCLAHFSADSSLLLNWVRLFIPGAFLIVPALVNILIAVSAGKKILLKSILAATVLLALPSFALYYNNFYFMTSAFAWGRVIRLSSLPYLLFVLSICLFLPMSITVFSINRKKEGHPSLSKRQADFVILSIIFITAGLLLNFLSERGIAVYLAGIPLLTVSFIVMSYSIVGYRLLEVDLIINKTVLALLFILPLFALHILISGFFLEPFGFIFAATFSLFLVVSLVIFTPYKNFMQRIVEKIVYRGRYDYQNVLKELCQSLTAILDFDQLCDYFVHVVVQTIGAEQTAVFLEDDEGEGFVIKSAYGLGNRNNILLSSDELLVKRIRKEGKIIIKDELAQFEGLKSVKNEFGVFKELAAEIVIPLFFKEALLGFIVLGKKTSGNIYNQGDVDVLDIFAKEAAKALEHVRVYSEAVVDSTTKVFNQHYFLMRLREEIARSKRYGHPIALLFIDINKLKKILGSVNGDLLLKGIGLLLKNKMRTVDVLARYKEGCFAIILPETARDKADEKNKVIDRHKKDALLVGERLLDSISEFRGEKKGQAAEEGVSIGFACFDGEDKQFTEEKFIQLAETALYEAIKKKGNGIVFFEEKRKK
ncbi:MAG: diguanylate cyclase [Candidatus Omnitrophica bacterium]|nr:diguanylate cyclase [Candidatus Omnitrophota bacterium]